jgi:acyl carrier protein
MSDHLSKQTWQNQTEKEVIAHVTSIVVELAPNPSGESSDSRRLDEDFEYHSLALLELAYALEDEFDLPQIDEATARKILTLQDVQNHVVKELKLAGRLKKSSD